MKPSAKELAIKFTVAIVFLFAFGQYSKYLTSEISDGKKNEIRNHAEMIIYSCHNGCTTTEKVIVEGMVDFSLRSVDAAEEQANEIYFFLKYFIFGLIIGFPVRFRPHSDHNNSHHSQP